MLLGFWVAQLVKDVVKERQCPTEQDVGDHLQTIKVQQEFKTPKRFSHTPLEHAEAR